MNNRWNGFLRVWLPVFLWMLFIFILSSVPGPDIPDLPIPFFHRVVHFIEYSTLGVLWIRAFTYGRPGAKFFKFAIFSWTLSAIFAFSDEWHQTFVPGRSGRLEDVYFDVIGAFLGILLSIAIQKRFGRKNLQENDAHV